jgi:hypothetical protein
MTTKTRPKTSTDELVALEAAAQSADGDVQALAQRAQQAEQAVNAITEERQQRQITHPAEFPDDGVKPNTVAAEITERLVVARKQYEQGDWQARSRAAAERARQAHDEVVRYRAANGRVLLEELRPRAEQVVAAFNDWKGEGARVLGAVIQVGHEATHVCTSSGVANPRSVPSNEHVAKLVADLSESTIQTPLPRLD